MFLSPTQALKQFKVSKPTLYLDMNKGKLSYKLDDRGKRKINVAELDRIYDKKQSDSPKTKVSDTVNSDLEKTFAYVSDDKKDVEIEYLKKMLQLAEDEKEHLRDSLKRSQEGHNRATMLLEDKTGGAGHLEKGIKALEARIANQEHTEKERQQRETKLIHRNKLLRKKLAEEQNKSWFKKIFA